MQQVSFFSGGQKEKSRGPDEGATAFSERH